MGPKFGEFLEYFPEKVQIQCIFGPFSRKVQIRTIFGPFSKKVRIRTKSPIFGPDGGSDSGNG